MLKVKKNTLLLLACLVFGVSRVKKGILLRKRKEKACPAS